MQGSFKSYRDLQVWQKSMTIVTRIYRVTSEFPQEEKFGLVSQMRRAAVSIPSNIAEGHSRFGPGEFHRGVSIAMGCVAELETQLHLCQDLGFMEQSTTGEILGDLDTIGKMLRGLQKSLSERRTGRIDTSTKR